MVFNSVAFFIFLPLVFTCFLASPGRLRWAVLLAASLVFYAFPGEPVLLAALAAVVGVSYACGLFMEGAGSKRARDAWFAFGVGFNLLLLAYLKYVPFLLENLAALLHVFGSGLHVPQARPLAFLGVSYFVFQAVSYVTDVHSGDQPAERHLGFFALYLAFFPKLLEGPIERAGDLLPQLKKAYVFDYESSRRALLLFAWGFYKKVVVADRLPPFVDNVFGNPHGQWGLPFVVASYYYTFQIYCDFSGYTDMALGVGMLFGLKLTPNFNAPYLSTSVTDFWRRWHISFSTWIRDYIFAPLQFWMRYLGLLGAAGALIITFTVVGLWHGANWCFVVFGLLHGIFMAFSVASKSWRAKLRRALKLEGTRILRAWQIVVTFNLVAFAFLIFRSACLADAWYMVTHLLQGPPGPGTVRNLYEAILSGQSLSHFTSALATLLSVPCVYLASLRIDLFRQKAAVRWAAYAALILAVFFGGQFYAPKQFIYFQF